VLRAFVWNGITICYRNPSPPLPRSYEDPKGGNSNSHPGISFLPSRTRVVIYKHPSQSGHTERWGVSLVRIIFLRLLLLPGGLVRPKSRSLFLVTAFFSQTGEDGSTRAALKGSAGNYLPPRSDPEQWFKRGWNKDRTRFDRVDRWSIEDVIFHETLDEYRLD